MESLHQEWNRRDGWLGFEVARKMIWAMLLDPDAFYTEFVPDSSGFHHFKNDIDALVFWNPDDSTTSHLESLRLAAIERLQKASRWIDDQYLDENTQMLEVLERVRVRYIDQPIEDSL